VVPGASKPHSISLDKVTILVHACPTVPNPQAELRVIASFIEELSRLFSTFRIDNSQNQTVQILLVDADDQTYRDFYVFIARFLKVLTSS
jgi:hypothetical protein